MSNNDTRTLLERACAKAVDIMLSGDDVATVRQATSHHVVIIRTVESDEREARTIQRRVEHAERTKADTERELSRVVDELAHVRETGAAELARASDDLVGAAAEIDALRAEVGRQTGIAVDHCARADAAEQMVAECCALLADVKSAEWMSRRDGLTPSPFWGDEWQVRIDAALSRTEAVAGRWVDKETAWKREKDANARADRLLARVREVEAERDEARKEALEIHAEWRRVTAHNTALSEQVHDLRMVVPERDAAIERATKAEADNAVLQQVIQSDATQLRAAIAARDEAVARLTRCEMDHVAEVGKVAAAERARDEVGIQLAAAQAEIARMRPVVEAARLVDQSHRNGWDLAKPSAFLSGRLAHLDAVPGDALAPVVRGAPFDEAGTVSPDKLTAALEASGIDSDNVRTFTPAEHDAGWMRIVNAVNGLRSRFPHHALTAVLLNDYSVHVIVKRDGARSDVVIPAWEVVDGCADLAAQVERHANYVDGNVKGVE